MMNAALMICDNNKGLKLFFFSEECINLCSSGNMKTGVKGGLKHNKIQDVSKMNIIRFFNIKNKMLNT